jgi:putative transposase
MDKQKETSHMKKKYEQKIEELYKEVGKLTTHLSWIKKKSGISMD